MAEQVNAKTSSRDHEDALLVRLRMEGKSNQEIAREIGRSDNAVRLRLQRLGRAGVRVPKEVDARPSDSVLLMLEIQAQQQAEERALAERAARIARRRAETERRIQAAHRFQLAASAGSWR